LHSAFPLSLSCPCPLLCTLCRSCHLDSNEDGEASQRQASKEMGKKREREEVFDLAAGAAGQQLPSALHNLKQTRQNLFVTQAPTVPTVGAGGGCKSGGCTNTIMRLKLYISHLEQRLQAVQKHNMELQRRPVGDSPSKKVKMEKEQEVKRKYDAANALAQKVQEREISHLRREKDLLEGENDQLKKEVAALRAQVVALGCKEGRKELQDLINAVTPKGASKREGRRLNEEGEEGDDSLAPFAPLAGVKGDDAEGSGEKEREASLDAGEEGGSKRSEMGEEENNRVADGKVEVEDVSDEEEVDKSCAIVVAENGAVRVFLSSTGQLVAYRNLKAPFESVETDDEVWDAVATILPEEASSLVFAEPSFKPSSRWWLAARSFAELDAEQVEVIHPAIASMRIAQARGFKSSSFDPNNCIVVHCGEKEGCAFAVIDGGIAHFTLCKSSLSLDSALDRVVEECDCVKECPSEEQRREARGVLEQYCYLASAFEDAEKGLTNSAQPAGYERIGTSNGFSRTLIDSLRSNGGQGGVVTLHSGKKVKLSQDDEDALFELSEEFVFGDMEEEEEEGPAEDSNKPLLLRPPQSVAELMLAVYARLTGDVHDYANVLQNVFVSGFPAAFPGLEQRLTAAWEETLTAASVIDGAAVKVEGLLLDESSQSDHRGAAQRHTQQRRQAPDSINRTVFEEVAVKCSLMMTPNDAEREKVFKVIDDTARYANGAFPN